MIIFAYYYLVFQKQEDEVKMLEESIITQDAQIQLYKISNAQVTQLKSEIAEVTAKLDHMFDGYLSDIDQEEIILLLNEIIVRSDIEIESISFSNYEDTTYPRVQSEVLDVSIVLSGEYEAVLNFLSSFWRFDQNIYIGNISMTTDEDIVNTSIVVSFVRLSNEYVETVDLFEWYQDNFYIKDHPFDVTDYSNIFKPNYFYTGTDVEFYNPPYVPFEDIDGHWAQEVLNFFGRNGYLLADDTNNIKPDTYMSRLETMIMLDRVFRWELGDDIVDLEIFDDFDAITGLSDIEKQTLLKAFNSGYLYGYDDNTLRPNSLITYEELGFIGANILDDAVITWREVATELENLFNYSSPGLVDETYSATKAEIVYFLSYIDQKIIE